VAEAAKTAHWKQLAGGGVNKQSGRVLHAVFREVMSRIHAPHFLQLYILEPLFFQVYDRALIVGWRRSIALKSLSERSFISQATPAGPWTIQMQKLTACSKHPMVILEEFNSTTRKVMIEPVQELQKLPAVVHNVSSTLFFFSATLSRITTKSIDVGIGTFNSAGQKSLM
jgi:hypothetical protein